MPYTSAFTIGTGGWTGCANALTIAYSSVNGVTAAVRLWRDPSTEAARIISLRAGEVLPLKVRFVDHNNVAGVTLIGLF